MSTELLRLIIQADTQGAVRGLEDVGRSADKNLGGAENRADRLAGNMVKFGAVALSAGTVVAAGLYKAGQAASDLGEQVSQTEQIFGEASGEIGSFAKGAAGSLGQSERAAREAANTFGLFFTNAGKSKTEAAGMSIELSKLASDMASFKNTTPEEAVEALGAALRGESEPIRRYGVMLDDATLKQRAMSMGLIETTTGTLPPAIKMQAAYAEILAKTSTIQDDFERTSGGLANQQRILAAEFENAKAALGQGALPVLTKLTSVAADAASGFSSLDAASGGAAGTIATVATGALLVGGGLSIAVGQAIKMRDNLSHLKGLFVTAEGGLNKLSKAGMLVGFAAGTAALVQMGRSMSNAAPDMDRAAQATDNFTKKMDENALAALALAEENGKLDDVVRQVAASSPIAADRMLGQAAAAGIAKDKIDELRKIVDEKRSSDVQGAKDQAAYSDEVNTATGATDGFGDSQEDAAKKVEELAENLKEATEAIEDNYSATFEATRLTSDYEAGIDDLIESLKENGRTLDLSTEKGRANSEQMIRTGETVAALVRKRYEETGSVEAATQAGELYVENLKNQLRQAGYTEAQVAELIAQMRLTPGEIRTVMLADVSQAERELNRYKTGLGGLPSTVTTTFLGRTVTRPTVEGRLGGNATGNPYFEGGLTWVGERGPEIVELPRGTRIHDAHKSAQMVAGSSGAPTVIHITTGADPQAVVDAIKRYTRSNGPLPASLVAS